MSGGLDDAVELSADLMAAFGMGGMLEAGPQEFIGQRPP
jgi:hypothetical protein